MICEGAITRSLGKICSSFRSDLWATAWWQSKPQNLHRLTEGTQRGPEEPAVQPSDCSCTTCLLSAACLVSGFCFIFFFSFPFVPFGAGFLFSSYVYSTEERKTDPWSSHLHKAQKHLSRAPCQRSEHQERDTAAGRLPLIKCSSFSVSRSSEWECLKGQRREDLTTEDVITWNEQPVTWCRLTDSCAQTSCAPGSEMPRSIRSQLFSGAVLIKVYHY